MKKYLLSIITFTAFIGFVAYATVETMPTGIEQPVKQDMSIVSEVKTPTNTVKIIKTNFIKKKITDPVVKTPAVDPTPVVDPIIINTPVTNTTEPLNNKRNDREEDDD